MMHVLLKDKMVIKEGDEYVEKKWFKHRWFRHTDLIGAKFDQITLPTRRHLKTMDEVKAFLEECKTNKRRQKCRIN